MRIDESNVTLAACDRVAAKISNIANLPKACHKYKSVVQKLQGGAQGDDKDAYAGLSPGQIARAKAAKLSGRETQAQFQRRMTRSHKMSR